jgi:hypothetical protein
MLGKAIDLDPAYAPALAHAAWCHEQRITRGWPSVGEDEMGTAVALARRAVAEGIDDALALVTAGFVLIMVASVCPTRSRFGSASPPSKVPVPSARNHGFRPPTASAGQESQLL